MYLSFFHIVLIIIASIMCTVGVMLFFFQRKALASFILTLFGIILALIAIIWPSDHSKQLATDYENSTPGQPMKTPIPYTYQPQVILDNGLGSIYLYKWDYVKGEWSNEIASENELEDLEIYRTVITFDGEYDYHYHAYLTIPGYTDTINLDIPASPYVLRTTKGEFEFMIGISYSSEMLLKEVFDVSSDSAINIDDSKLIN